jgi:hypothetical protein
MLSSSAPATECLQPWTPGRAMNPEAISLVDGFKQCLIFATKSGCFCTCAEHCLSQPMTADWESRTIHGTGRGAPSIPRRSRREFLLRRRSHRPVASSGTAARHRSREVGLAQEHRQAHRQASLTEAVIDSTAGVRLRNAVSDSHRFHTSPTPDLRDRISRSAPAAPDPPLPVGPFYSRIFHVVTITNGQDRDPPVTRRSLGVVVREITQRRSIPGRRGRPRFDHPRRGRCVRPDRISRLPSPQVSLQVRTALR